MLTLSLHQNPLSSHPVYDLLPKNLERGSPMPKISIQNGPNFDGSSEQSFLDAAVAHGLLFPHSCKNGRCSRCRCRVVGGEYLVSSGPTGLTAQEKADGYVLGCVTKPLSDVELADVEVFAFALPATRVMPCRIVSISRFCESVIELEVRFPPNQRLEYIAGQYVDILFENNKRSYSIANFGHPDGNICFHIKNVEGGLFSDYIFNRAKEGDLLRIKGPYGTFFPRDVDGKHLVFLATGTGYGPVRAIIQNLLQGSGEFKFKSISLFRGVRDSGELYLEDEKLLRDINYVATVSKPTELWSGETKYVQDLALEHLENLDDMTVFACGSSAMIEGAMERFTRNGLKASEFYSDAFVSSD